MNNCPTFNEDIFIKTLQQINNDNPGENLLITLDNLIKEPCPIHLKGGKKGKNAKGKGKSIKKSKKTSIKQKGGVFTIKQIIKMMLYLIISCFIALGLNSPNSTTIINGLTMLYNGQCSNIGNRIWGWVGLENPICAMYNKLFFSIIPSALLGNPEAIATLTGVFTVGIGGPFVIANRIDSIASSIENSVRSQLQLQSGGKHKTYKKK